LEITCRGFALSKISKLHIHYYKSLLTGIYDHGMQYLSISMHCRVPRINRLYCRDFTVVM